MAVYSQNFLTNVIAKVDYQPILALLREAPIDFQSEIRQRFPRFQKTVGFDVTIPPEGETQQAPKPILWQFMDKTESQTITLSADFILYEVKKYTHFDEFYQNLSFVYEQFCKKHQPSIIKRIGLRYINQIQMKEGNPFDWDTLIKPELTKIISAFPGSKENIARAMSQIQINEDDAKIIFQFGLFNSEYPAKVTKREFVLDYDCSTEDESEPDRVLGRFGSFNVIITKFFEDSILDELRDKMGEAR